jgi:hypothetical protein
MSEIDKSTFGFALTGLAAGLITFGFAFVAGAYLLCVKYDICLFHPGKFL